MNGTPKYARRLSFMQTREAQRRRLAFASLLIRRVFAPGCFFLLAHFQATICAAFHLKHPFTQ